MSDFQIPEIKTKKDLSILIEYLKKNGFGYFYDDEFHRKKVDSIIDSLNVMDIKYDIKFKESLYKLNSYDEIKNEAEIYFSKFSKDDKIIELIDKFYLISDSSVRIPYNRPDITEVIEWVDFKKKYNLNDIFNPGSYISYYNLDKNYLKISYGEYEHYNFRKLYEYIFNEPCAELNTKKIGDWINIGKIEIKFFANGRASIKGDLVKFKEYYNNSLIKKHYNSRNDIIKYNNKINMLVASERD